MQGIANKRCRARIAGVFLAFASALVTHAALAADVVNQASVQYSDAGGPMTSVESNTVTAQVPVPPPDIEFVNDNTSSQPLRYGKAGRPLFVQIKAGACNRSAGAIDIITVKLRARKSGDVETYTATETGFNTATFRVGDPIPVVTLALPVIREDHELEVARNDRVIARITDCSGVEAETEILMNPAGVVFDSSTDAPVVGATVRLVQVAAVTANASLGRKVALSRNSSAASNGGAKQAQAFADVTAMTDEDGVYVFEDVPPGHYWVAVDPPGDYQYPSVKLASALPAERELNPTGSFAAEFFVSPEFEVVAFDIPVDSPTGGLVLENTVSRQVVEVAETVQYTLTLSNLAGIALNDVRVDSRLPVGLSYISGTARLDGQPLTDPVGGAGPLLTFGIGNIAATGSNLITYRVKVGPGALQGDGINPAQASSQMPARKVSNVATAKVITQAGVFDDRAFVLGTMYADCNGDGRKSADEPGVPGVRLFMEDGAFVITDGQGRYSFYGVSLRTHVLKVDGATLPSDATLAAISHRNSGEGGTRFVDVKRGELHRADFALAGCAAHQMAALQTRRELMTQNEELDHSLKAQLTTETQAVGDARALPASGFVNEMNPANASSAGPNMLHAQRAAPHAPVPSDLQKMLIGVDRTPGFISLLSGTTVASNRLTLHVKGPSDARLDLEVNGKRVPESRIGTRVISEEKRTEIREYIGIELEPGTNHLKVMQRDAAGNVQMEQELMLEAPGELARIVLSAPVDPVAADGQSIATVSVRLQDRRGLSVGAPRLPVSLDTTAGTWQVADLDPALPGIQTFVEGSSAEFALMAPSAAGAAQVRISSNETFAETEVQFTASMRPLVGAGVIEGALDLHSLDPSKIGQARKDDGFEEELTDWAGSDGKYTGGGRAALFLKGKVRGDYLLTLAYDSQKDQRERLFRDIQPDKYYAIYGDSAIKGFDAQSTGRLYVRVDKGQSWMLAGDYTTQAMEKERQLGAYNRSLNGLKQHVQTGRFATEMFASRDAARRVVREIPADGTSGPYFLPGSGIVENSEQVEIITRSRDQSQVVIDVRRLQRFADYQLDAFTGELFFNAPRASVDKDLNPLFIRVSYESDEGGEQFWVSGAETQVKLTDSLQVSAAVVEDQDPQNATRLGSVSLTAKLSSVTTAVAEAAYSDTDVDGSGLGQRFELRHEGTDLQVRAFGGHTDEEFNNTSALLGRGRVEAGARANYNISERTRLIGQALRSGDVETDATRTGGLFGIERTLGEGFKVETGVRYVHADAGNSTTNIEGTTTTVRGRLTAPWYHKPDAKLYAEYEQDVHESDNRVAALGGEYLVANRVRLYARHELISSLTGPYSLDVNERRNSTVFGLDRRYLGDDRVFTEYRVADAISGREAQGAIGLRNRWPVAPGLRFDTSFERIHATEGSDGNESMAVTGGVEYTRNPLWKGTARLELRDGVSSDGLLSTVGVAYKLSSDWSVLGKNILSLTRNEGSQPNRNQERLQFGIAYRDTATNRINALARYEFKQEQEPSELGLRRTVHLLSAHADYQLPSRMLLTGQYAVKFASESGDGMSFNDMAQLVGARVTRDIGRRWDAGLALRALCNEDCSSRQNGFGGEVGYLVKDNLWVSAGYNFAGFSDRDLAADGYSDQGMFLRMRFKFDESLFAGLSANDGGERR